MFISKKVLLKVRFLTSICMALAIISSFCLTPFAFAETKPYAAQPSSSLTLPAQLFIGESFSFTASFDNTNATDTGYGPFIDLVFPRGADGDDGISFVGADYLGAPVTSITLTFPGSGCVAHPYARDTNNTPLQVCGTPGDTLVVLQLPFGSFTPDQPAADINVQATISNKADENVALPIYTRAGFQYGNDPLDNPAADPALVTNPSTSSNLWAVSTVTPDLIRLTKTYLGEEDEPVNGPNFIRRFKLSVDIAPGQTVTNLDLTDILPGTMQFVALVDTTVAGSSVSTTVLSTPSTTNPGGTLSRRFASVTGTTSSDDASMIFSFYVPRVDINTAVIIDANSGDDVTGLNNASVTAAWDPVDTRDPNTTPVINPPGPEYTLQYKSIAIQKHVVNATDPITTVNDLLLYTLDIQVSDYFAFQNIVVHDNFSDGQRFDPTFDPTLSCTEHNASTTDIFALTNYTVDISQIGNNPDLATDGSTTMVFRISDELIGRGASFADGQLVGGGIPDGGTGAGPLPNNPPMPFAGTTCQIQYRTQIQDSFSDTYPSGDQSVDQGDTMFNNVTISGDLLNVTNLTPNGQQEADLSASQIEIARGKLTKTIYAINGSTTFASPVEVQPGDTVTYRLMYELPSSDIEDLKLTDYLPLPVFKVASFSTSFDPTVSAAAPAAGSAKYGPTDTFSSLVSTPDPTLSVDAGSNSLTFSYGSYDNSQNVASVIDLLLSVTVSNDPFADGLFLTNQVRQSESSTQNVIDTRDAIIQIKLTEPVLRVLKGVVASSAATPPAVFTPTPVGPVSFNAPGTAGARFTPTINSTNLATQPINSNLSGVDAGDLVTFAIVIENTGNSSNGAYDVSIKDSIPAGFAIPAGGPNLRVVNGAGTLLSYPGVDTDLFTTGISLVDGASGAIAGYDANSGTNIVVASYDLVLQNTPTPSQTLTNTAIVANYANTEAGPNFVPGDILKDTATVTTAQPKASKSIVTTSESFSSEAGTGTNTSPRQVAIGEIVRYRLLATVPEGSSPNMILRDNLPAGLIFLDLDFCRFW